MTKTMKLVLSPISILSIYKGEKKIFNSFKQIFNPYIECLDNLFYLESTKDVKNRILLGSYKTILCQVIDNYYLDNYSIKNEMDYYNNPDNYFKDIVRLFYTFSDIIRIVILENYKFHCCQKCQTVKEIEIEFDDLDCYEKISRTSIISQADK